MRRRRRRAFALALAVALAAAAFAPTPVLALRAHSTDRSIPGTAARALGDRDAYFGFHPPHAPALDLLLHVARQDGNYRLLHRRAVALNPLLRQEDGGNTGSGVGGSGGSGDSGGNSSDGSDRNGEDSAGGSSGGNGGSTDGGGSSEESSASSDGSESGEPSASSSSPSGAPPTSAENPTSATDTIPSTIHADASPDASTVPCAGVAVCDVTDSTTRGFLFRRNQKKLTLRRSDGSDQSDGINGVPEEVAVELCRPHSAEPEVSALPALRPVYISNQKGCARILVPASNASSFFRFRFDEPRVQAAGTNLNVTIALPEDPTVVLTRPNAPYDSTDLYQEARNVGVDAVYTIRTELPLSTSGLAARDPLGLHRIHLAVIAPCACIGSDGSPLQAVRSSRDLSQPVLTVTFESHIRNTEAMFPELGWEETLYPVGTIVILSLEGFALLLLLIAAPPLLRLNRLPFRAALGGAALALFLKLFSNGLALAFFHVLAETGRVLYYVAYLRLPFLMAADVITAGFLMMMAVGYGFVPWTWRADDRSGIVQIGAAVILEVCVVLAVKIVIYLGAWYIFTLYVVAGGASMVVSLSSSGRHLRFVKNYTRATYLSFVRPSSTPLVGLAYFFALTMITAVSSLVLKAVFLVLGDEVLKRPDLLWIGLEGVDASLLLLYTVILLPRKRFALYADMSFVGNSRLSAANAWRARQSERARREAHSRRVSGDQSSAAVAAVPSSAGGVRLAHREQAPFPRPRRRQTSVLSSTGEQRATEHQPERGSELRSAQAGMSSDNVNPGLAARGTVRPTGGLRHMPVNDSSSRDLMPRFAMRDFPEPRGLIWRMYIRLPDEWITWRPGEVPLPIPTRAMWGGFIPVQHPSAITRVRRAAQRRVPNPEPPVILIGLPMKDREDSSIVLRVGEPFMGPAAVVLESSKVDPVLAKEAVDASNASTEDRRGSDGEVLVSGSGGVDPGSGMSASMTGTGRRGSGLATRDEGRPIVLDMAAGPCESTEVSWTFAVDAQSLASECESADGVISTRQV